ncbi:MAG: hypothetical protein MZV64_56330 [Ignavibacteriales bacterium]|nr:hypothetical protein [Ignavibacteriales bacterium]
MAVDLERELVLRALQIDQDRFLFQDFYLKIQIPVLLVRQKILLEQKHKHARVAFVEEMISGIIIWLAL